MKNKKQNKTKKEEIKNSTVKPWLTRKNKLGIDNIFLQEFWLEDDDECKSFLRMTQGSFK